MKLSGKLFARQDVAATLAGTFRSRTAAKTSGCRILVPIYGLVSTSRHFSVFRIYAGVRCSKSAEKIAPKALLANLGSNSSTGLHFLLEQLGHFVPEFTVVKVKPCGVPLR